MLVQMVCSVINTRLDDEEMAGLQDSAEVIQGRNCRSPAEARGRSAPSLNPKTYADSPSCIENKLQEFFTFHGSELGWYSHRRRITCTLEAGVLGFLQQCSCAVAQREGGMVWDGQGEHCIKNLAL